ncbi:MAG: response regulator [Rhodospirillales bacterium]|nr:response regulator [Rhodospirillales bacterium]
MTAEDASNKDKNKITRDMHILLIEDSESDAYTVKRVLSKHMKHPCRVVHAESMAEAEGILSTGDIDLILLDLGLPDTDGGHDTFHRLSGVKEDIPVIILTSMNDHEMAVSIVGKGAEDFVRKSVISSAPDVLCDVIDFSVCRHKNMLEIKAQKEKEINEKNEVIQWVTGGYSA